MPRPADFSTFYTVASFTAGQNVTASAVIRLGGTTTTTTSITIESYSNANIDVVGDVTGYYVGGPATAPGMYRWLDPRGIVDTALDSHETATVPVLGRGGLSASGVAAVDMTVSAVTPSVTGWLTAAPTGSTARQTLVNYTADKDTTARAVIRLAGATGISFTTWTP
jgi:hypothetical protein